MLMTSGGASTANGTENRGFGPKSDMLSYQLNGGCMHVSSECFHFFWKINLQPIISKASPTIPWQPVLEFFISLNGKNVLHECFCKREEVWLLDPPQGWCSMGPDMEDRASACQTQCVCVCVCVCMCVWVIWSGGLSEIRSYWVSLIYFLTP